MQIAKHSVVSMNYTLKNDQGQVMDTSVGREPLVYLHGAGNIIPGLEAALDGKVQGDNVAVRIAPENAYGVRNPALMQRVPKASFQGVPEIKPGMQFRAQGPQGQVQVVTVTAIEGDTVTVDANHPLAGIPLNFEVSIVEVRTATAEEISHGHVHGAGGQDHGHEHGHDHDHH